MAYRSIVIGSDVKLSLKNRQLCIKNDTINDTVPIEDIDTILIESPQSSLSTALIGALAKSSVALFICDEFHMPCAVLLPYLQHSRQHEITKRQLDLSIPAKKRLWQQIVISKISNQAKCLSLQGYEEDALELERISKSVKSGDSGYTEGHAAAKYFSALFGDGVTRGDDLDCRNGWLNYGYAIVRGCVARTLSVYGLMPLFGIQHHSQLNQFNLADDFIEPFRPIVDLFAAENATSDTKLTPEIKRSLVNLINYNILVDGKKYSLSYAIELAVKSFSSVLMEKRKDLLLPELMFLELHKYE
ncbi:MAG: type II CRISPR-associated endonuclease Cas1 [Defluviitaleaceae bacterium]|nr:type II CRISPR-associated endonuclease Cas1 [Defluviitaleaceae bacterium]